MKREDLTAEDVRKMLDYDPRKGTFIWRHRPSYPRKWNSRFAGKPAGTRRKTGYVYIEIVSKLPTKAARIAWLVMTGKWPDGMVDHRNGIRDDDRWVNLRLADSSENGANRCRARNNTSGHVGVHFEAQRARWRARINFRRVSYDVGFFDTAEEAATARAKRLKEIQGEFATTNPERPSYFHYRDAKRTHRA